jgi:Ran GTPase-activating protein (RanGAP) involved in mRNA processing and transport
VTTKHASKLLEAILKGRLLCIKHLVLARNRIEDEVIDMLVETMPFLELLDLEGNWFSAAGSARLHEAAERYSRLTLNL